MSLKPRTPTIDETVSSTALKNLAEMDPAQFIKQLQTRGIHSLEDLAHASISTAQGAVQGGSLYIDPDLFPVCYKFTVKPHRIEQNELGELTKLSQRITKIGQ